MENLEQHTLALTNHFFRNEYGKMVAVITRYIGTENVETAEDIVQETLLNAVDNWQHNGIPDNPQAWLYATAKNLTFNILKRKKHEKKYIASTQTDFNTPHTIQFSEQEIKDEQLNMMFVCCHPAISEKSQITLILKILCGFSINEIAHAFFSSHDTINKRLVRGRQQLRDNKVNSKVASVTPENLNIVLKTIYLLFNEGYSPSKKETVVRYDLCFEAIRLVKIIIDSTIIKSKTDSHALLALMYLNASRFESRMNHEDSSISLEDQDRSLWNKELIQLGAQQLNLATKNNQFSSYLILATISANHCISKNFKSTNWKEILDLYQQLLQFEDSPIVRLNRSIALSKVAGYRAAINELTELNQNSDIGNYFLFHATLAQFYANDNCVNEAISAFKIAVSLTDNQRDIKFLEKKLKGLVPIP